MIRKIKIIVSVVFMMALVLGIAKSQWLDTPARSVKKISTFHAGLKKNDINTNLFARNKALTYKMYFFALIPLGKLEFQTKVQDSQSIFSFEANTEGTYLQRFIKARARIESFFDYQKHLTDKYVEETEVRGKVKTKEIVYDHENLVAIRKDQKVKIPPDIHDPIGAFLDLLSLPQKKGDTQRIRFMTGDEVYVLKATCLDIKNEIAEILIDMRREDLTSSHGATFRVWVTADNARIPLLFKSWTPVGYMSVALEKAVLS